MRLIITNGGGVIDPEARQSLGSLQSIRDNIVAYGPTGRVYSISGENANTN